MAHFRTTDDVTTGATIHIVGEEALHAHTVRRNHIGDSILVTGANNIQGTGTITNISPERVTVSITHTHPAQELPPTILGIAITKKPALEEVVQHATELGATDIALWHSDHSPITLPDVPSRLERIAREACKQSDRPTAPHFSLHPSLTDLLTHTSEHHLVVLDQHKHTPPNLSPATPVCIIVGPEGGLSDEEATLLETRTPTYLSLAPFTLRAPTAALAGLTAINLLRQ